MEMSLPNDYVSFNVETTPRTSWGVTDRNLEYAVVKHNTESLDMCTEHRTMSCKKSSYAQRKLLLNGHDYLA